MMAKKIARLILIYNANAGLSAAIIDSARKLFHLNPCSLCSITHGLTKEKAEWRDCQRELGAPIDYLHKDELTSPIKEIAGEQLPCVLAQVEDAIVPLLSAEKLASCHGAVSILKAQLLDSAAANNLEF
jgi:hypothetical protein